MSGEFKKLLWRVEDKQQFAISTCCTSDFAVTGFCLVFSFRRKLLQQLDCFTTSIYIFALHYIGFCCWRYAPMQQLVTLKRCLLRTCCLPSRWTNTLITSFFYGLWNHWTVTQMHKQLVTEALYATLLPLIVLFKEHLFIITAYTVLRSEMCRFSFYCCDCTSNFVVQLCSVKSHLFISLLKRIFFFAFSKKHMHFFFLQPHLWWAAPVGILVESTWPEPGG